MTRAEAIILLLALPDEPCLRRGYRYTYPRDPMRDPEVIKRDLGTAYVQHCRQDLQTGGDISCVVSVRRQARLRVVKRA